MKKIFLFCCFIVSIALNAQPYLDLGKIIYHHSPEKIFGPQTKIAKNDLYSINLNLPIEIKKGGDAFLLNPFFDHNKGEVEKNNFEVISIGLFTGFLKKNIVKNWDLLSAFIIRSNRESSEDFDKSFQYGGVLLTTWKKNPGLSFKFGLYYNKEFFGNYFMPLVGIDWKIDAKDNLFGILPGNMTWEHKVNQKLYYGFAFRALTNSFRLQTIDPCFSGDCTGKNYLRIDDNQLGFFADRYLTKQIVATAEAGYTILRRYRFGFKGNQLHLRTDYKNDNFYFRVGLAYRLRFR